MDKELIAYFDERFARLEERGEKNQAETSHRFESLEGRFESLEGRFESLEGRFESLEGRFESLEGRFEKLVEAVHLTQVTVESLHSDLRLVAEGVMGISDTVEKRAEEVDQKLDEVKSSVALSYKGLSRRVVVLEERAARETRDIMDVIREK